MEATNRNQPTWLQCPHLYNARQGWGCRGVTSQNCYKVENTTCEAPAQAGQHFLKGGPASTRLGLTRDTRERRAPRLPAGVGDGRLGWGWVPLGPREIPVHSCERQRLPASFVVDGLHRAGDLLAGVGTEGLRTTQKATACDKRRDV